MDQFNNNNYIFQNQQPFLQQQQQQMQYGQQQEQQQQQQQQHFSGFNNDPDTIQLIQTLQKAISQDTAQRRQAEQILKQIEKNPYLPKTLINIFTTIIQPDQNLQQHQIQEYLEVQILASVYFRNLLKKDQYAQMNEKASFNDNNSGFNSNNFGQNSPSKNSEDFGVLTSAVDEDFLQKSQKQSENLINLMQKTELNSEIQISVQQDEKILNAYMLQSDQRIQAQLIEIIKLLSLRDFPESFTIYHQFLIKSYVQFKIVNIHEKSQQDGKQAPSMLQKQNFERMFILQYHIFKNLYKEIFEKISLNGQFAKQKCLAYFQGISKFVHSYMEMKYQDLLFYNNNFNAQYNSETIQQQMQQNQFNFNYQFPLKEPKLLKFCLKTLNLENYFAVPNLIYTEKSIKLLVEIHELFYNLKKQIANLLQHITLLQQQQQQFQQQQNQQQQNINLNQQNFGAINNSDQQIQNQNNLQNAVQLLEKQLDNLYETGQFIYYKHKYFLHSIQEERVIQNQGVEILDYLKMYYFYNLELKNQELNDSLNQVIQNSRLTNQIQQRQKLEQQQELLEIQSLRICSSIYESLGSIYSTANFAPILKEIFDTNSNSANMVVDINNSNKDDMYNVNKIKGYFNEDFIQVLMEYLLKKLMQKDQWQIIKNEIIDDPESYFNDKQNPFQTDVPSSYNLKRTCLVLIKTLYTVVNRQKVEQIISNAFQKIYHEPVTHKQWQSQSQMLVELQEREVLYFLFGGLFRYLKSGLNFDAWFENSLRVELEHKQNSNFLPLQVSIMQLLYELLSSETDNNFTNYRNNIKNPISGTKNLGNFLNIFSNFLTNKETCNLCIRLLAFKCSFKILEIEIIQFNLLNKNNDLTNNNNNDQQQQEQLQQYQISENNITQKIKQFLQVLFEFLEECEDIQTQDNLLNFLKDMVLNLQKLVCTKFQDPIFQFLTYAWTQFQNKINLNSNKSDQNNQNDQQQQQFQLLQQQQSYQYKNKSQNCTNISILTKIADITTHLTKHYPQQLQHDHLMFYNSMITFFLKGQSTEQIKQNQVFYHHNNSNENNKYSEKYYNNNNSSSNGIGGSGGKPQFQDQQQQQQQQNNNNTTYSTYSQDSIKDLYSIEIGLNLIYQVFSQINNSYFQEQKKIKNNGNNNNNNSQNQFMDQYQQHQQQQQQNNSSYQNLSLVIVNCKRLSKLVFANPELFQICILIGIETLHLQGNQEIYNACFQLILVLLHKYYRNIVINYEYIFDFMELYIIKYAISDPLFDISIEGMVIALQSKAKILKQEVAELQNQWPQDDDIENTYQQKLGKLKKILESISMGILRTLHRLSVVKPSIFIKLISRLNKIQYSQFLNASTGISQSVCGPDFLLTLISDCAQLIQQNKAGKYKHYKKILANFTLKYVTFVHEKSLEKEQQALIDQFQEKITLELGQNQTYDEYKQQLQLENNLQNEFSQTQITVAGDENNNNSNNSNNIINNNSTNLMNLNNINMNNSNQYLQKQQLQQQKVIQPQQKIDQLLLVLCNIFASIKNENNNFNNSVNSNTTNNYCSSFRDSEILYNNYNRLLYQNDQGNNNQFGHKNFYTEHIEATVAANENNFSTILSNFKEWSINNENILSQDVIQIIQQNQLFN